MGHPDRHPGPVHVTLPDGLTCDNVFMQNIHMRWARITEIHTLEDERGAPACPRRIAAGGNTEARDEPATDTEREQAR